MRVGKEQEFVERDLIGRYRFSYDPSGLLLTKTDMTIADIVG